MQQYQHNALAVFTGHGHIHAILCLAGFAHWTDGCVATGLGRRDNHPVASSWCSATSHPQAGDISSFAMCSQEPLPQHMQHCAAVSPIHASLEKLLQSGLVTAQSMHSAAVQLGCTAK